MATVRDRLWLWGHDAGVHNGNMWGLPGESRMTPGEAAFYMNVPNMIMVRYEDRPAPPFDQYALALRPLKQLVWSIVGAGGKTYSEERQHVLDLARRTPNITGVMMDDFFTNNPVGATLTVDEVRGLRDQLRSGGKPLDLWVVLYDHQLDFPVADHLAVCDKVTFWTWKAEALNDLERNFERAERLAPRAGKLLGLYMWDYGTNRPMPIDLMRRQCKTGLRLLREGRIEGMILLATCICDLNLEAVEWSRQWVADVGGESIRR